MMRSVMAACALAGGLLLTFAVAGSKPATAGEAQAADAQASYYRGVYRGPRGGVAVRTGYYGSRGGYYRGGPVYRGPRGGVAVVRSGYYGGPRYYGGGYRTGYYRSGYGYRGGYSGGYGYRTGYYGGGYGAPAVAVGYSDYNDDGYPDGGYYGGDYNGDGYADVGYYGGGGYGGYGYGGGWGGGWGGGYGGCRVAYIPYGWTWYRATNC